LVTYSGSRLCSIRHHLISVECSQYCFRKFASFEAPVPQRERNVSVEAKNTSNALSVVVTVQAVNHLYHRGPPSTDVRFQFANDTGLPDTNATPVLRGGPLPGRAATPKSAGKPKTADGDSSAVSNTGLIVGIVLMAAIAGGLLALLLWFLISRCMQPKMYCKQELRPLTPESVLVVKTTAPPPCPPQTKSKSSQTFDHSFYVMKSRRSTPTTCLRRDYEDRLRPNCHYAMKAEFERVPRGPTDSADEARLAHNSPLNRSQDALPYDKNRVRLTRGRLADRTYINASLIRTVRHQPSVVVAQHPTEQTVPEFWRLVWDLNIGSLVTLVPGDLQPAYWPERTDSPAVYSDVRVELVTETPRAHFVLRRFRVHGWEGECVASRLLFQWHFLRWASNLPRHPVQFLDFVRDFQTKHGPDTGMLVQCALGAGPSGLFLSVDALSTEGRRTGQLDVEECATLLCLERMNVVQTFHQYRYIYYCLLEQFDVGHDTCIPVSCFHFAFTNLIQRGKQSGLSHLDREFCVLSFPCYGVSCKRAKPRCCRSTNNNDDNNVIRRSHNDDSVWLLDGYLTRDLFVISRRGAQFAAEFWKTVLAHGARTALVLRPLQHSGLLLPCRGACSAVGEFVIECKKVRQNRSRSFLVHNLTVARFADRSGGRPVRLYEFVAWPDSVELPDVGLTLDLVSSIAEWCRRDVRGRSTVFHVSQSPTDEARAATVCAVWSVLDRIHAENLIDIYSAVRYLSSVIPSAFTTPVSRRISTLTALHFQHILLS